MLGHADDLVADHFVCEVEGPVELGHDTGLGLRLEEHVVPLGAVVELVRQPPPAPPLDPHHVAAARADEIGGAVDRDPDRLLLQADIEDDHDLVRPHERTAPPSGPGWAGAPAGAGAGFSEVVMLLDTGDSPIWTIARPHHADAL